MTAAEAKSIFLTRYYAATSVDAPGWVDAEIVNFISQSTHAIIQEVVAQQRFDIISELTKGVSDATVTGSSVRNLLKTYGVVAPSDYMYFVHATISIQKSILGDSSTSQIPCDYILPHEVSQYLYNNRNNTYFRYPKIFEEVVGTTKKLMIIFDSYTTLPPGAFNYTYIKEPEFEEDLNSAINNIVDVNVGLHEKIIEGAVRLAVDTLIRTEKSSQ